jgi:hypothetical protein
MNRPELIKQLEWLKDKVLPGFEQSNLPDSWKAESIRRTRQQIDDLEYLMETDPPRKAPQCGWKKSYRLHDTDCKRCSRSEGFEPGETGVTVNEG